MMNGTAQHAIREGRVAAQNITLALAGRPPKPFSFKTIGLLASIGRRTGVARIFGFNFSGFFAWWLWRTIYLSKLPGFDKKVRVAFDWGRWTCSSVRTFARFMTSRPAPISIAEKTASERSRPTATPRRQRALTPALAS